MSIRISGHHTMQEIHANATKKNHFFAVETLLSRDAYSSDGKSHYAKCNARSRISSCLPISRPFSNRREE